MQTYHVSVLLAEAIEGLQVKPGKKYIDATLGGGGHTGRIIEAGGEVLALDMDREAIENIHEKFKVQSAKFKVAEGNFKDIDRIAREHGFEKVSGILFDLGVSSHQFDTKERGFSFLYEAQLDMRMGNDTQVMAKDLINGLTESELTELFIKYGEEKFALRIAKAIVLERKKQPIETTLQLAELIKHTVPRSRESIHPATRVFQALRIAVNDELHSLREALPKAVKLLDSGGRLVVISFHSLEDRIVKHTFLDFTAKGWGTVVTKHPITPGEEEIMNNSRARSAKMRIFEKN